VVKKLACFQQLQGSKDSNPSLVHLKDSIAQGFQGYNFLSSSFSKVQNRFGYLLFTFLDTFQILNHSYLSSKLFQRLDLEFLFQVCYLNLDLVQEKSNFASILLPNLKAEI
jgi:hypothetical protein